MNYTQKIAYAKEILSLIKEQKEHSEIADLLAKKGLDKWQIEKVIKSSREFLKDEYRDRIRDLMIKQELENHLDDFDELDAEIFEEIQLEVIQNFVNEGNQKVRKLLGDKKSEEEIIEACSNDLYTVEHIEAEIERYNYYHTVNDQKKSKYHRQGLLFICIGIFLSYASAQFLDQKVLVFYGFILYGIWCFIKASMTQSDIDSTEKEYNL